jgi:hypothetical protein
LVPVETAKREFDVKKPANGGHFFCVSLNQPIVRLDGGGRSHDRTRLHTKFPANREKNREFCDFNAVLRLGGSIGSMISDLSSQIPYTSEQGICCKEQGNIWEDQGIVAALF